MAAIVAAILLVGIAATIFYEVLARFIFRAPTEWSLELSCYALVWSAFLGAAYTLDNDQHVKVEVLTERLPGKLRRLTEILAYLAGLAFCALATWKGLGHVRVSYINEHTSNTPLSVPMYTVELAVPVGMLLLALAFFRKTLLTLFPVEKVK